MLIAKKGLSPLISWVLLVGFVVGLSVVVTTWVKDQAETRATKLVIDVESDIRCNDVAFNINLECNTTPKTLAIANKGKFTIDKITLRQPGNILQIPLNLEPTEQKTENLNSFDALVPADIIPSIMLEGKNVICSTRKIVVSC